MERGKDGNTYFRIPPRRSKLISLLLMVIFVFAILRYHYPFFFHNLTIYNPSIVLLFPILFFFVGLCQFFFSGKKSFAITPSGEVHIGGRRAQKLEINMYDHIPGRESHLVLARFAKSNIKNKYAVSSVEEQKAAKKRSYLFNPMQYITNYYATNTKTLVCIEFKEPLKEKPAFYTGGMSSPTLEKIYVTVKDPQKLMNYLG